MDILNKTLFPAPKPASYNFNSIKCPPLCINNGVPSLWFSNKQARYTILYLHDNSVDLGMIQDLCKDMAHKIECNVLAIEYPGYGVYSGTSSPDKCIEAAIKALQGLNGPVVLMGRSIGAAIAAATAFKLNDAPQLIGLILISGFYSLERAVEEQVHLSISLPNLLNTAKYLGALPNIPLLLIHGENDPLFPVDHALSLFAKSVSYRKQLIILRENTHVNLSWDAIFSEVKMFIG